MDSMCRDNSAVSGMTPIERRRGHLVATRIVEVHRLVVWFIVGRRSWLLTFHLGIQRTGISGDAGTCLRGYRRHHACVADTWLDVNGVASPSELRCATTWYRLCNMKSLRRNRESAAAMDNQGALVVSVYRSTSPSGCPSLR